MTSGWYILGPSVQQFEAEFGAYCGVEHCIGVGNGTDALEIALRACGVGPGKRVLTVANAGGYSTTAILAAGAEPAYVDIDPRAMLMSVDRLRAAIRTDAAALVITHLYGRLAEMPAFMEVAANAGIPVIEDCAQAHGARLDGKMAGSWGAASCFSFYPTKNLGALGDGGAVLTNDSALATRIRALRQYGWRERYRAGIAGGTNSRLDEMQAAMLSEQLGLLDDWNARRREIATRYSDSFRDLNLAVPDASGPEYVAHLYVLRTQRRDEIRTCLAAAGVSTDVHYPIPDHQQPAWSGEPWARVSLPETERACCEVLTVPCFPELTDDEVATVINAVRQAAAHK